MQETTEDLRLRTLERISETGDISAADIFILKYCERERSRAAYVSPMKKLMNGAGDILGFAKSLFGGEAE